MCVCVCVCVRVCVRVCVYYVALQKITQLYEIYTFIVVIYAVYIRVDPFHIATVSYLASN